MAVKHSIWLIAVFLFFNACTDSTGPLPPQVFQLLKISAGEVTLSSSGSNTGILPDAIITVEFSTPVDTNSVKTAVLLQQNEENIDADFHFEDEFKTIVLTPNELLTVNTMHELIVTNELKSVEGASFPGVSYSFNTENGEMSLELAEVNGTALSANNRIRNVSYNDASLVFEFSESLDPTNYASSFSVVPAAQFESSLSADNKTVTLTITESLNYYAFYTVLISGRLEAENGFTFPGYSSTFQTGLNPEPKLPMLSDEALLTKVQEQTFKYFWDFGHPVSGLARERNSSGETVTIGGSGFGIMAILVGIERGFITRSQGIDRLLTIVDFLENKAERFHGAWSHWLNGSTGKAIAFSAKDDGADLVETAFMAQGLIAVREYLNENDVAEATLIAQINRLLDEIEWDWFTRGGQNVLYWHWSPNFDWDMNMRISGYNEALIVYVLAASSTTHGIDAEVYRQGWARSGDIRNGNIFYGFELPVGFDFGGPLFFAHYSFLGLNPQGLSDTYADYWVQNRNHTLINRAHSIENPRNFVGYSDVSWGLTASDEPGGYSAHEPSRDNGTITPTAAISSIPFTPDESLAAMRHFYFTLGDKLWGEYGFYDAFNPTENWWANSYLAIDQGPIIVMIENYRSGLLWDLFMSAPEVQNGLNTLGFTITD
jgi:hypothetical protein